MRSTDRRSASAATPQKRLNRNHLKERRMTRANLSFGVIVLASLALELAGCGGGSSSPGVAHLASSKSGGSPSSGGSSSPEESTAGAQQKMVAYAQCIRTHGVPEFP